MNKNDLQCSFQCNSLETQEHIFQECQAIIMHMKEPITIQLSKIFGSIEDQSEIIHHLIEIEGIRTTLKEKLTS